VNIVALIIAIVAFVVFLSDYERRPHAPRLPTGLALLVAALIVQFVWQAHIVVAH